MPAAICASALSGTGAGAGAGVGAAAGVGAGARDWAASVPLGLVGPSELVGLLGLLGLCGLDTMVTIWVENLKAILQVLREESGRHGDLKARDSQTLRRRKIEGHHGVATKVYSFSSLFPP